jgi:hypothetical protein
MKRILLGHLAIDSACVVLADPASLANFDTDSRQLEELLPKGCPDLNHMHDFPAPELPFSRDACWIAQSSRDRGGILGRQRGEPGGRFGEAIAVSTGLGDGLYPVYALITEPEDVDDDFCDGRVVAIVVDFEVPLAQPQPQPRRARGQGLRDLAEAARTLLGPLPRLGRGSA